MAVLQLKSLRNYYLTGTGSYNMQLSKKDEAKVRLLWIPTGTTIVSMEM